MEKIDFVLTWVDGSDPGWLAEKQKYMGQADKTSEEANDVCRYRADTELLRYWFRGVEKFAPWVNRIHFVTCGQKPEWLDETNPKLNFVDHKDFIPKEYLPTFNSNTIELNFHRIEELAERFVMFNDDMFLIANIDEAYFFKGGNPVLTTDLRYPSYVGYNNWSRFVFNDYCVVNNSFNLRKSIWKNRRKWFDVKELGFKRARQNFVCYIANKTLPVGTYGHFIQPHFKSTLAEVWDNWFDVMDNTCKSKFRSDEQVNQYLLCAWNQAKGCFYPTLERGRGKLYEISPNNMERIVNAVRNQQYSQICLNDSPLNTDANDCVNEIIKSFNHILPNKSSFEK